MAYSAGKGDNHVQSISMKQIFKEVHRGPCLLNICHFLLLLKFVPIIVIYCRAHKEAPASDGTMTSLDASPEGTEPEIDHSSDHKIIFTRQGIENENTHQEY